MTRTLDSTVKEICRERLAKGPLTKEETKRLLVAAGVTVTDADVNLCHELMTNVWAKDKIFEEMVMFIDQLLSDDTEKIVRELFDSLDANHDGVLSEEEVVNGFKTLGIEISEEEVKGLFKAADENANQFLEFEEFRKAIAPHL